MLYRISVAERGLTGIANIFRSRLSGLDDLLRAGTVPLMEVFRYDVWQSRKKTRKFGHFYPGGHNFDLSEKLTELVS